MDSECDLEVESLRRASEASLVVDDEERQLGPPEEDEEDEDTKARKEHLEQGKIKWEVYGEYAKACGPINVVIFLGFCSWFLFGQCCFDILVRTLVRNQY